MEKYYWDTRVEYLVKSRSVWFNFDYIEFLVKQVWKIENPVNIADFGCGNGFLGAILLPLLPKGSTYTGYDKGEKLIENAKSLFENSPYKTQFIQCDLVNEDVTEKYDLVICQAFLMHIPQPQSMLKKMIETAVLGGLVICIETNWNVSNAALYIDGLDVDGYCNLGILQKLWKQEKQDKETDKCIGMKIPCMMQELGLKDIGIRMNDCVRFANPYGDESEYKKQSDAFKADGWGRNMGNEDDFVSGLISRGVSKEEARLQYQYEKEVNDFIFENSNFMVVNAPPLFISYGKI